MLRELSIRELSDIEMDLVSGGEGDVDEVIVTATIQRRDNPSDGYYTRGNLTPTPGEIGFFSSVGTVVGAGLGAGFGSLSGNPAATAGAAAVGSQAGESAALSYLDWAYDMANMSPAQRDAVIQAAQQDLEANYGGCHNQCNL